jgi:hypothetical protein
VSALELPPSCISRHVIDPISPAVFVDDWRAAIEDVEVVVVESVGHAGREGLTACLTHLTTSR